MRTACPAVNGDSCAVSAVGGDSPAIRDDGPAVMELLFSLSDRCALAYNNNL